MNPQNYIGKARVKTAATKSDVKNAYWRNVLQRARAADHRIRNGHGDEPVFSNAAKDEARRMVNRVAGTETEEAARRFLAHVEAGNPYAAYHTCVRLERKL